MTCAIGVVLLFLNERYNAAPIDERVWSPSCLKAPSEKWTEVVARWTVHFAGNAAIIVAVFF
jgi:hypothetical protein